MEDILLPHEAIIRLAGSQVVMTGYHAFNGTRCVANKWLQQDLLRKYVGFDGLLVSDYGSIPQIDESLSPSELCAMAMNAGNEVDFPTGEIYAHIPEALEKGLISEAVFEKAVKHVLMLKAKLGLLDNTARLYSNGHIEFDTDEERATSYKLATQSIVLLKTAMQGVMPNQSCRLHPKSFQNLVAACSLQGLTQIQCGRLPVTIHSSQCIILAR